jgi:hypothetical protein
LTPIELESVKEIQISETTSPADASSALPHWLMVKKSFTPQLQQQSVHAVHRHRHSSSKKRDDSQLVDDGPAASADVIRMIELIGIPSNSDRKMHFFHVKLVNSEYIDRSDVWAFAAAAAAAVLLVVVLHFTISSIVCNDNKSERYNFRS